MRMTYDRAADALAVELGEAAERTTRELAPGTFGDFDQAGRLVGLEILGASGRYPLPELEDLDDGAEWMTLREAAAESRAEGEPISPERLRALLVEGRLEGRKVGRDWQIRRADLWTYLENRPGVGRPPTAPTTG